MWTNFGVKTKSWISINPLFIHIAILQVSVEGNILIRRIYTAIFSSSVFVVGEEFGGKVFL
ncbi:MAG: hypothetical protein COV10_04870 [Candidatus Vogelbacteria bacterium CG10_big_fil_rev_8_21_14_0_10_51_16]|uniref:Uncharacterized protein n=1 Tax=Candidatus Vogelbacteria bacterium CG10_big_fil_rev_8_21_14_0_10_51_16 TaxID=1975045 RepID=A0A2H0RD17_9BACT|nr:MAG: hypothetical protein COV10_04870 [Candidatus Vogelbacteria bacterium CG10_big_fil_rev_8_21_14_0_10_51_16]